jgi:hypothetical protein
VRRKKPKEPDEADELLQPADSDFAAEAAVDDDQATVEVDAVEVIESVEEPVEQPAEPELTEPVAIASPTTPDPEPIAAPDPEPVAEPAPAYTAAPAAPPANPEYLVGAAFAGGLIFARLLKRLAR